ncbi:MAG TPA: arsenosugar biosynthesis radical SAM (seleno)protein ArsS [Chitinivibrionales bacterium]|jgi:radical SAM/Cys-rich protein|nr:arsenosugar biosynthesis radical SAM (seleno)protein ArsS [Chitinivibrionales bacterium]
MEPQTLPVPTPFEKKLKAASLCPFVSKDIVTLQINVGKRCTLRCKHCHVEAGPGRTEMMERSTFEKCLTAAAGPSITTIDITGGAPEMNPHVEWFLDSAAQLGKRLIVRTNLVILLDKEYEPFVDVYVRNRVELAASLPHWKAEKCDRQRGEGAFDKIVGVIRMLNGRGYGREGSELVLDLVHNPMGSFLPGPQAALEREYKAELATVHGITFNKLFCLANSPVGRFKEYLATNGTYEEYMATLERAFNSCAAENAMCRTMLSIGWDGAIYDCDFNQMLSLRVDHGAPNRIEKFDLRVLRQRRIVLDDHCYACTAGQGSSCQGATGTPASVSA